MPEAASASLPTAGTVPHPDDDGDGSPRPRSAPPTLPSPMQYGVLFFYLLQPQGSCGDLLHSARAMSQRIYSFLTVALDMVVCLSMGCRRFSFFFFLKQFWSWGSSCVAEDSFTSDPSGVLALYKRRFPFRWFVLAVVRWGERPGRWGETRQDMIVTFSFCFQGLLFLDFCGVLLGINFQYQKTSYTHHWGCTVLLVISQWLNSLGFILFSVDLAFSSFTLIK